MNILLIAGIWLAIAALASLLIGGGARLGSRGSTPPNTTPRRASTRDYVAISFEDWALAAHADATRALLSARPVTVRRFFDQFPERDG